MKTGKVIEYALIAVAIFIALKIVPSLISGLASSFSGGGGSSNPSSGNQPPQYPYPNGYPYYNPWATYPAYGNSYVPSQGGSSWASYIPPISIGFGNGSSVSYDPSSWGSSISPSSSWDGYYGQGGVANQGVTDSSIAQLNDDGGV
jgi:hypothetical protein